MLVLADGHVPPALKSWRCAPGTVSVVERGDGHNGLNVPLRQLNISGDRLPFNCPRPVYASLLSLPSWPWLLDGYAVRQICPWAG